MDIISKEQWSRLISALIAFIIAVLVTFGFDVFVDTPRDTATQLLQQQATCQESTP